MYIVNWLSSRKESSTLAVGSSNELIKIVHVLNSSDDVIFWNLGLEYKPEFFGWTPHWEKYKEVFFENNE